MGKASAQKSTLTEKILSSREVVAKIKLIHRQRNPDFIENLQKIFQIIPDGSEVVFYFYSSNAGKKVMTNSGKLLGYVVKGSDVRVVIETNTESLTFSLNPISYLFPNSFFDVALHFDNVNIVSIKKYFPKQIHFNENHIYDSDTVKFAMQLK